MQNTQQKSELERPGIYLITNKVNGLIYIGKSINLYNRKSQYNSIINGSIPTRNYNKRFLNHLLRFGNEMIFEVLEFVDYDDELLSERELFWIKYYNSLDKNIGYNLSYNSNTKTVVSDETRNKISNRLKREWNDGTRSNHSQKLSDSWKKRGINGSKEQSAIMKKVLTKYNYKIIFKDRIEIVDFSKLKLYNLHNVLADFYRKKSNIHKRKDGIIIERINIEDIVQPSTKVEG